MNEKDLSIRQLIEYRWKSYIKIGATTYIRCPIHGDLSPATIYGYNKWIDCTQCLKIRIKLYERDNKIESG